MKRNLAVALRVVALVGVVSANWVIPARAEEEPCYGCIVGNCFEIAYGSGHTYCQAHEDHCDLVGGCVKPM